MSEGDAKVYVFELINYIGDEEVTYFGITNPLFLNEFIKETQYCLQPIEHIRTFDIEPHEVGHDVTSDLVYIIKNFIHCPVLDCRLLLKGMSVEMPLIWRTLSDVWGNSLTKLSVMNENVFDFDIRKFEVLNDFTKLRSLEIGIVIASSLDKFLENLPRQVENLVVRVHAPSTNSDPSFYEIVSLALEHLHRFKIFELSFTGETSNPASLKIEKESLEALYKKYAHIADTNNTTIACTIQGFENENLLDFVRFNKLRDCLSELCEANLSADNTSTEFPENVKRRKCDTEKVHILDKKFENFRDYASRKIELKRLYDASVKFGFQEKADSLLNSF